MRGIPLKGHKNTRCTETWCYCYDEDNGDPVCSCGRVAFACECNLHLNDEEDEPGEDKLPTRDPKTMAQRIVELEAEIARRDHCHVCGDVLEPPPDGRCDMHVNGDPRGPDDDGGCGCAWCERGGHRG